MGQREIDSGFVPATGWRMPVQYSYPEAMAVTYTSIRVGAFTVAIPVAFVVPKLVPVNHAAMTETPVIGCPVTAFVTFAKIAAESRSIVMFGHVVTYGLGPAWD